MMKTLALVALLGLGAAAQAQQLMHTAQGNLLPLTGPETYGSGGAFVEIFGAPDYRSYMLPAVAPGQAFEALAQRATALSAAYLSQFTQATARFSYDPATLPTQTTMVNGRTQSRYDIAAFDVQIDDGQGASYVLSSPLARAVVGDGRTSRFVSISNSYVDFPPPPFAGSPVYTDPAPQSSLVDLRELIASDVCLLDGGSGCSTAQLDLGGVGPLPVLLHEPDSFRARFLNLTYSGSRLAGDPVDASLPNPLDGALYDRFQQLVVAFDGDYSWTLRQADYASPEAFAAAQTWIGANVLRISFEQLAVYQITSTTVSAVPEPATTALWAAGGLMLLWLGGRRRRPGA